MTLNEMINENNIILELKSTKKKDILIEMIDTIYKSNLISEEDIGIFYDVINDRENINSTAIGKGIAIPHGVSSVIKKPVIVVARSKKGVHFDSIDKKPVKLFFMIALPTSFTDKHLSIISELSKLLLEDSMIEDVLRAQTAEDIRNTLLCPQKNIIASENDELPLIVAITACPTGIAHTYIAESELKKSAATFGYNIKIETHGNKGVRNKLSEDDIKKSIGVIIASDLTIDTSRFKHKKIIETSVSEGVRNSDNLIKEISNSTNAQHDSSSINTIYKHLLTGFSYMMPFAMVGAIALSFSMLFSFLLESPSSTTNVTGFLEFSYSIFNSVGIISYGLMPLIISGFIAFSIADKSALILGFIFGGFYAINETSIIGAIFTGYAAGYLLISIKLLLSKLPTSLSPLRDILLYPLFGFIGMVVITAISAPLLKYITDLIIINLHNFGNFKTIVISIVIAFMMNYDLGGPINKIAYIASVSLLFSSSKTGGSPLMTAVMVSGMIPPLSIYLSIKIFKCDFSIPLKDNDLLVKGLSFVSESALPFVKLNSKILKVCFIIGASFSNILIVSNDIKTLFPHGGFFIFGLSSSPLLLTFFTIVGSLLSAILIYLLLDKLKISA